MTTAIGEEEASVEELFERRIQQFEDDFLKFDGVESKFSTRPDLHAFIFLDRLLPETDRDIVCSAGHDQIWLDVSVEILNPLITDDELRDLVRCGIMYDTDDGLTMFA